MRKRKWTDQDFVEAVRTSTSYAQVIEKLNLRVAGSNYDTVKRKISELHLINAVRDDQRLENLQLLCPNCHALTDNYRGRNKVKSAQVERSEVEVG